MAKLGDITGAWNTIREIDVGDIREEAEYPVTIAVIGESILREAISMAIEGQSGRFPAAGLGAILEYPLPVPSRDRGELSRATIIILAFEAHRSSFSALKRTAEVLATVDVPVVTVCVGADRLPQGEQGENLNLVPSALIFVPEAAPPHIATHVIPQLVEQTPAEQQLAVARSFPGTREVIARKLVGDTAFSNAAYALTAAVPELIPILNLPLNAADLLVLTKNQALMVYKLGLAFGAPGDFQAQMREIIPVIGGGFVWRQVARQLIGLVPGFGLVPKVAVAYAGTYAAGQVASIWYHRGEVLSQGALRRLYKQAWAIGRQRATDLLARRREQQPEDEAGLWQRTKRRIRGFLPDKKEPPPAPDAEQGPGDPPELNMSY